MRTELDDAAFNWWREREDDSEETCSTCNDTGWITEVYGEGEVVRDGCPGCAPDFDAEKESIDEARARMTAKELAQDRRYERQKAGED